MTRYADMRNPRSIAEDAATGAVGIALLKFISSAANNQLAHDLFVILGYASILLSVLRSAYWVYLKIKQKFFNNNEDK